MLYSYSKRRANRTPRVIHAAAMGQLSVAQAPVVIAACGTETEYIMPWGQYTYPIDVAISVDHMNLEAVDQVLGLAG